MSTGVDSSEKVRTELPSEDEMRLPPRRVLHARDTSKATNLFHASLLVMLVLISVSMIVLYQIYGE